MQSIRHGLVRRPHARCVLSNLHARPKHVCSTSSPDVPRIAVPLQVIKGNVLSGTVLGCFGCFWFSWGMSQYWILIYDVPVLTGGTPVGYTLYLVLWGVLATGFFVVTLATNYCLQVRLAVQTRWCSGAVWLRVCMNLPELLLSYGVLLCAC